MLQNGYCGVKGSLVARLVVSGKGEGLSCVSSSSSCGATGSSGSGGGATGVLVRGGDSSSSGGKRGVVMGTSNGVGSGSISVVSIEDRSTVTGRAATSL